MRENATLNATLREERGKSAARRMRREGWIPANMYGRGEETHALTLNAHDFQMLLKNHALDTTIVELKVDGLGKSAIRTLVAEVQSHPYRPEVLHVDFQQIHAGERVTVEVPIRLEGNPEGVKEGGVLQHVLHTVELVCAVEEIPEALVANVAALEIGDSIHVSELDLPQDVELLIDADRTVCTVAAPSILEVPEEEEEGIEMPELVGAEEGEEPEAEAEGEAAEGAGEEE